MSINGANLEFGLGRKKDHKENGIQKKYCQKLFIYMLYSIIDDYAIEKNC
jgi:hypothetical protein